MAIFDEIKEAVANENFKMGAGFPAARLQTQTIDYDRQRTMMGDNALERQNAQNHDYHIVKQSLLKRLVEPDIESAGAYKDIRTGVSETSQGFHFANQGQQISASIANNMNNMSQVVQNLQTQLNQLVTMVAAKQA